MKIENWGKGKRCESVSRTLVRLYGENESPLALERIIILPIPTTRDGVCLNGTKTPLSEMLSDAAVGDGVVGYGIPPDVREELSLRGAFVIDVSLDEKFLLENAEITAVGALSYLLSECKRVPSECKIGIVGYGRIGRSLLRTLLFLGAKIRLYTSKKLTRVELCECGIETFLTDWEEGELDFSGIDVLINTAPTSLSRAFANGEVPRGLLVLDLASGDSFPGISGVVRLAGIPDKFYPDSATEAYLSAVLRGLSEVEK